MLCPDSLYENADIKIVTAARLSATFPYVTPVSRADKLPTGAAVRPYHIADGGYYDNYGVMTIVEWLDKHILPHADRWQIGTVVFVQIQITETSNETLASSGWQSAFIGPLVTLFNVRQSTQRDRNNIEIGMLKRIWTNEQHPVENAQAAVRIESPVFGYSGPAVLSWNLTGKERGAVGDVWTNEARAGGEAFQTLDCYFKKIVPPHK